MKALINVFSRRHIYYWQVVECTHGVVFLNLRQHVCELLQRHLQGKCITIFSSPTSIFKC